MSIMHQTAIFAALCVMATTQGATTRLVPSEYPTISIAVNACLSGDTVLISKGMYWDNVTVMGKGVNFVADGDVTVYPDVDAPVFTVSDTREFTHVKFDGLTIRTTRPGLEGAGSTLFESARAIEATNAKMQILSCTFAGCVVGTSSEEDDQFGAAVRASGGHVFIHRTVFEACTADQGGAIAIWGGSAEIAESVFRNNHGSTRAGALMGVVSNITLSQCAFKENWTLEEGGHVVQFGGSLDLNRCRFTQGYAADGGAVMVRPIWNAMPTASMSHCRFEDNGGFAGVDVWKQTAGAGPEMGKATYCGTGETQGGVLPAWSIPVSAQCDVCPSDTTFDEAADIQDVIEVLMHWGEMDPFTTIASSSDTNGDDLLQVLEGYGACTP